MALLNGRCRICPGWNRRVSLRPWLMVVAVIVSLLFQACSYYYYTVEERTLTAKVVDTPIGPIQFEIGKLNPLEVSEIYADEVGPEVAHQMGEDTTTLFLGFKVYIRDTVIPDRILIMDVDSIYVDLSDPYEAYNFAPIIASNRLTTHYSGPDFALDIEPIRIPHDYNQDFHLVFTLRVFDQATQDLVVEKDMRVKIIYHRERYFLFDAPYG